MQNWKTRKKWPNEVGIGAIIFSELSTKRVKDVLFDWNEILKF